MNKILKLSLCLFTLFLFSCDKAESNVIKPKASDQHISEDHFHPPHNGISIPVYEADKKVAYAEVKLHDDKGDIELWLTVDRDGTEVFDLDLASQIKLSLPKLEQKNLQLLVRNTEKNEDEDGKANNRSGKTNYFIFPSKAGQDASFLKGQSFSTEATLSFTVNGKAYSTKSFKLSPHVH